MFLTATRNEIASPLRGDVAPGMPLRPSQRWRRCLALSLALATLSIPSLAAAQSASQQQSDSRQSGDARVLYQKGNAAFKRGDHQAARAFYAESLQLVETFDTLCNLGRAEEKSELLVDSYYHLGLCLELYPRDAELQAVQQKFAALHEEVGEKLSPEERAAADERVQAHMEDRAAKETAAQVQANSPKAESPAVSAKPPTKSSSAEQRDPEANYPWRWPVVAGVGLVGVAGVGVGAGLMVDAAKKKKQVRSLRDQIVEDGGMCPDEGQRAEGCDELDRLVDARIASRNGSTIALATGGTLIVGSVLLYALWPHLFGGKKRSSSESMALGPSSPALRLRPEVQLFSPRGQISWSLVGEF